MIGGTRLFGNDGFVSQLNGQFLVSNEGDLAGTAGWYNRSLWNESTIIGGGLFWDLTQSPYDNTFHQVSFASEIVKFGWLPQTPVVVRPSFSLPVGSTVQSTGIAGGGRLTVRDTIVGFGGAYRVQEAAISTVDVEASVLPNEGQFELFAAWYYMNADVGDEGHGVRGGMRAYLSDSIRADVSVSGDEVFGTNVSGGLTWFFGGDGGNQPDSVWRLLRRRYERNGQVAINRVKVPFGPAFTQITDQDTGDGINAFFVAEGANGAGTQDDPSNINAVLADADFGAGSAMILLDENGNLTDQIILNDPRQQVIGGGDTGTALIDFSIATGDPTNVLALMDLGGRPVLATGGADAVILTDGSEAKGFAIDGAGNAIVAGPLVLSGMIDDLVITNSTTSGLLFTATPTMSQFDVTDTSITGGAGTGIEIAMGSQGTFSFGNVDIINTGDVSLAISGGDADVMFDAASSITQTNDTSTVSVTNGHSGDFDFAGTINATNGDGLQFDDADGTYDFTGTTTLNGGDASIDIIGNSNGTFTFSVLTSIINPTGDAFVVDGDDTNSPTVTYSGTIQNDAERVIRIESLIGPNAITFDSLAVDAIQDSGTGIFIEDVAGPVNFTADIELTGTVGVDILGGSGGFTFTDTDINPTGNTGPALAMNGTTATVDFEAASSITQTQDAAAVDITGDNGMLTLGGTINATNGPGIVFDNADGTYDFNGNVILNGTALNQDVSIDVSNDTDGIISFDGLTQIVNNQGDAVSISGGDSDVSFANIDINQTVGNGITANGGGSLTITGGEIDNTTMDGINVINTDLSVSDVVLGGDVQIGGDGIDVANTADQTVSIDDTTVTNAFGAGITIDGSGGGVTTVTSFDSNIVTDAGTGGILFNTVTFDADPVAAMIQQVNGGTTAIGGGIGQRVEGDGLSLVNVTGDLAFTSLDIFNNNGTGLEVIGSSSGPMTTFNLVNGGGSIDTTGGLAMFLDPLTTDLTFDTVTADGGTNGIVVDTIAASGGVGMNALTIGTLNVSNTIGDGVVLVNNNNGNFNIGTTGGVMITDAGGDGIELDGNSMTTAITFGNTTIDLGTTTGTAGINYVNGNGPTTFGDVTITDVGVATNQVGIDFNGATLSGTAAYNSVDISGPDTSTTSIGVDLTGLMGDQIVNLGAQVAPATGPDSSITDLHRGVVIDNTAAVQFTFGDGEDVADIGSIINVNGQAGAYTVDAGNGTLAASSFDFSDVMFGAGDTANFPTAPDSAIFVSTNGGMVAMGTNGLSQDLNTISVADALMLVDPNAVFAFVAEDNTGIIDVTAGGANGFALDIGQSIDGFNNGNGVTFRQLQPTNVTGNFGAIGRTVTADSAIALNSNAVATSVITAAGNNTVENNIVDGTGTTTSLIDVSGVAMAVTLNGLDLQNIQSGSAGVNLDDNDAVVMLTDVDLVGMGNTGTALQIDATAASIAQITADAASDIDGTTGTVVSIGTGARDINLSAVTIDAMGNTDNVIDVNGQTGGTIMFGDVDIAGFNDGAGTAVNLQGTGGTVSFTDLDIATTAGAGLNVGAITFAPGATPTINATGANALTMNGTTLSGGAATFASVTSTGGATGINLDNVSGLLTFTTVDIDNSTGDGISLDGSDSVTISGGTIDGTAGDGINSINTDITIENVTIGGNLAVGGDGIEVNNDMDTLVAINGVTVTNATGAGILVDGADGGTTTVTSLSGNTVSNARAGGILFETVTFDAGPMAMGIQTVNAGNTNIGDLMTTTNVTGDGLVLNDVLGAISFGTLNIGNDNGTGLFIRDDAGKMGSFAFSNTGGSINTTNGAAIDIDPVAMNSTFASVSSTGANGQGSGGSTGIVLDTISGTVNIGEATVSGATADGIVISNSSANVNFGDLTAMTVLDTSITGVGDEAVSLVNNTGNVTFQNLLIADPVERGIEILDTAGDVTVQGGSYTSTQPGGGFPVTIQNQTAASTISFTNFDITGTAVDTPDLFNIQNSNGAITVTGGTFQAANDNDIVDITGGAATINIGATIIQTSTNPDNSNAVEIDDVTGGSITFTGPITQSGLGSAVDLNNNSGLTINFNGLVSSTGMGNTNQIVDLTNNTGATINFNGGLNLGDTTGVAFNATGGGTVNVMATAGTEVINNTVGQAVNIDGIAMGIAFDSVSSVGSANEGIEIDNATGTFLASGGSITNATGTAFDVTGGSADITYSGTINNTAGRMIAIADTTGGAVTFNSGAMNAYTDSGTGILIDGAAGNVTLSNGDLNGTSGIEILGDTVNAATGTYQFNNVTVDVTGAGLLVNGGAGDDVTATIDLNNVDITNPGGRSVSVTGMGGGSIDFDAASVIADNAGLGMLFDSNSAGSTTFNGNVTLNTGANIALDVNASAGHGVNFDGTTTDIDTTTANAIDITGGGTVGFGGTTATINTTSGTGLNAVGGGTTTVTGNAQITTTTGTGVNINGTTIGAGGVTVQSVSVNGATNGIVVTNTGTSGGFTVTGDLDSAVNGSGGLLQNITGDAILLTDTMSASFDQLNMSTVGGNGILGVRVNGLTVSNATFTTIGDADPEDVFSFNRDTLGDNGLIGTARFENLTITNFAERGIDIVNEGSGMLDLDIINVSMDNNDDTFGEDAIRVQNEGTVNTDLFLSGGTYNNIELDVLAYFAQGTGTNNVEVTGVTSTNGGGPDNNPNGGGIAIVGSAGSTTTFDINANNLTGVQGAVVQIIGLPGAGQTVTMNGVADANIFSSDNADGIDLDFDGDPGGLSTIQGTIFVENNTINFEDDGIGIEHRDAAGEMFFVIRNNTLTGIAGDDASTADIDDGIFISTDDDVGAAVNQLNVNIIDNVFNNIQAGKNIIEVVDVLAGNQVCFNATGNSIGAGTGSIELDTSAMADLVIDALSSADLSSLNNSIPVVEINMPTYDNTIDCLPAP